MFWCLERSTRLYSEPFPLFDLALDLGFHTADVLDNFGGHVATVFYYLRVSTCYGQFAGLDMVV